MNEIILDGQTTAREFNTNLKRAIKEHLNIDVRVRIINSYKFPRCYVEVWLHSKNVEDAIPNAFRELAYKEVYKDSKPLNPDNIHSGNIRPRSICLYAHQWESVFQKHLNPTQNVNT
jgi:hypothetical protein